MAATGPAASAAAPALGPQLQLVLVVGASYGEQLAAQLQAAGANVIPCLQPQVTLQALQLVSRPADAVLLPLSHLASLPDVCQLAPSATVVVLVDGASSAPGLPQLPAGAHELLVLPAPAPAITTLLLRIQARRLLPSHTAASASASSGGNSTSTAAGVGGPHAGITGGAPALTPSVSMTPSITPSVTVPSTTVPSGSAGSPASAGSSNSISHASTTAPRRPGVISTSEITPVEEQVISHVVQPPMQSHTITPVTTITLLPPPMQQQQQQTQQALPQPIQAPIPQPSAGPQQPSVNRSGLQSSDSFTMLQKALHTLQTPPSMSMQDLLAGWKGGGAQPGPAAQASSAQTPTYAHQIPPLGAGVAAAAASPAASPKIMALQQQLQVLRQQQQQQAQGQGQGQGQTPPLQGQGTSTAPALQQHQQQPIMAAQEQQQQQQRQQQGLPTLLPQSLSPPSQQGPVNVAALASELHTLKANVAAQRTGSLTQGQAAPGSGSQSIQAAVIALLQAGDAPSSLQSQPTIQAAQLPAPTPAAAQPAQPPVPTSPPPAQPAQSPAVDSRPSLPPAALNSFASGMPAASVVPAGSLPPWSQPGAPLASHAITTSSSMRSHASSPRAPASPRVLPGPSLEDIVRTASQSRLGSRPASGVLGSQYGSEGGGAVVPSGGSNGGAPAAANAVPGAEAQQAAAGNGPVSAVSVSSTGQLLSAGGSSLKSAESSGLLAAAAGNTSFRFGSTGGAGTAPVADNVVLSPQHRRNASNASAASISGGGAAGGENGQQLQRGPVARPLSHHSRNSSFVSVGSGLYRPRLRGTNGGTNGGGTDGGTPDPYASTVPSSRGSLSGAAAGVQGAGDSGGVLQVLSGAAAAAAAAAQVGGGLKGGDVQGQGPEATVSEPAAAGGGVADKDSPQAVAPDPYSPPPLPSSPLLPAHIEQPHPVERAMSGLLEAAAATAGVLHPAAFGSVAFIAPDIHHGSGSTSPAHPPMLDSLEELIPEESEVVQEVQNPVEAQPGVSDSTMSAESSTGDAQVQSAADTHEVVAHTNSIPQGAPTSPGDEDSTEPIREPSLSGIGEVSAPPAEPPTPLPPQQHQEEGEAVESQKQPEAAPVQGLEAQTATEQPEQAESLAPADAAIDTATPPVQLDTPPTAAAEASAALADNSAPIAASPAVPTSPIPAAAEGAPPSSLPAPPTTDPSSQHTPPPEASLPEATPATPTPRAPLQAEDTPPIDLATAQSSSFAIADGDTVTISSDKPLKSLASTSLKRSRSPAPSMSPSRAAARAAHDASLLMQPVRVASPMRATRSPAVRPASGTGPELGQSPGVSVSAPTTAAPSTSGASQAPYVDPSEPGASAAPLPTPAPPVQSDSPQRSPPKRKGRFDSLVGSASSQGGAAHDAGLLLDPPRPATPRRASRTAAAPPEDVVLQGSPNAVQEEDGQQKDPGQALSEAVMTAAALTQDSVLQESPTTAAQQQEEDVVATIAQDSVGTAVGVAGAADGGTQTGYEPVPDGPAPAAATAAAGAAEEGVQHGHKSVPNGSTKEASASARPGTSARATAQGDVERHGLLQPSPSGGEPSSGASLTQQTPASLAQAYEPEQLQADVHPGKALTAEATLLPLPSATGEAPAAEAESPTSLPPTLPPTEAPAAAAAAAVAVPPVDGSQTNKDAPHLASCAAAEEDGYNVAAGASGAAPSSPRRSISLDTIPISTLLGPGPASNITTPGAEDSMPADAGHGPISTLQGAGPASSNTTSGNHSVDTTALLSPDPADSNTAAIAEGSMLPAEAGHGPQQPPIGALGGPAGAAEHPLPADRITLSGHVALPGESAVPGRGAEHGAEGSSMETSSEGTRDSLSGGVGGDSLLVSAAHLLLEATAAGVQLNHYPATVTPTTATSTPLPPPATSATSEPAAVEGTPLRASPDVPADPASTAQLPHAHVETQQNPTLSSQPVQGGPLSVEDDVPAPPAPASIVDALAAAAPAHPPPVMPSVVPEKVTATRSQPSRMASVETLGGFENVIPPATTASAPSISAPAVQNHAGHNPPAAHSVAGSNAEAETSGSTPSDIDLRPWPVAAPVMPEPLNLWSAAAAAAVLSPRTAAAASPVVYVDGDKHQVQQAGPVPVLPPIQTTAVLTQHTSSPTVTTTSSSRGLLPEFILAAGHGSSTGGGLQKVSGQQGQYPQQYSGQSDPQPSQKLAVPHSSTSQAVPYPYLSTSTSPAAGARPQQRATLKPGAVSDAADLEARIRAAISWQEAEPADLSGLAPTASLPLSGTPTAGVSGGGGSPETPRRRATRISRALLASHPIEYEVWEWDEV